MGASKALGIPAWGVTAIQVALVAFALYMAWDIRLLAVRNYGRVIHEFDPWFNFRATEYLVANGYQKFSTWFDTLVWCASQRSCTFVAIIATPTTPFAQGATD